MTTYTCPVCGFPEMGYPPENDAICPVCLTHFGYDDFATSHEQLRERWMATQASLPGQEKE